MRPTAAVVKRSESPRLACLYNCTCRGTWAPACLVEEHLSKASEQYRLRGNYSCSTTWQKHIRPGTHTV